MKLFLDANILVAILNKEYPVYSYAARILSLMDSNKATIYTSPICLAIAFYFAEKKSGNKLALQKIGILSNKINITNVTEEHVLETIQNKKINDFEDGLEYYSAMAKKCTHIITEDLEDFYFSKIPVYNCKSFFYEVLNATK